MQGERWRGNGQAGRRGSSVDSSTRLQVFAELGPFAVPHSPTVDYVPGLGLDLGL